jgi:hypothetical protein
MLAREVINFLNQIDREIEQHGKDGPIQQVLARAPQKEADTLRGKVRFRPPDPAQRPAPSRTRIGYSRDNEQIEFLKEALGVNSAKAVGERTFDDAYREQKGK